MKRTRKGFTLLEIIIVLLLVTLIMGLSAVFFSNFLPSVKFNAAGREMAAMIRHARALARMKMASQTFVIDLDNKTYGIEGLTTKQIPQDSSVKVIDPVAGEITRGKYSMVFNPAGSLGGGRIILSTRKKTLRIDMDPIMGAVLDTEGH
ncbi:MAG: prepilin-type N-terminal cleavage/methylation domain-containing protein [Syntrophales bacterium]|nr:prepilin-type N-terminal cleavage/methylation domain-containing protein [Syntrophales bacterium]